MKATAERVAINTIAQRKGLRIQYRKVYGEIEYSIIENAETVKRHGPFNELNMIKFVNEYEVK